MREALARPGMDVLEFSSAEARERVMQLLIRSHRHGAPQGIHCQRVVMGLASLMAPEAVRDAVRDLERGNEVELLHWPRWGQRDNRYHALDGEDRYLHVEGWEARAGVRGDRPECLEMAEAILRQAAVGGEDELLAIRIQEPLDLAGWTTGAVFEALRLGERRGRLGCRPAADGQDPLRDAWWLRPGAQEEPLPVRTRITRCRNLRHIQQPGEATLASR